ncbi:aldose 1-epimerase [uncultured Maribacter sp.]|uniref:aldose 1-epimerase n=1 Tax=uncultured Maribacter sp. TaxID=431308 RepID=UPI0026255F0E|nr:aldose 1-epimerase [uncultured Maribacter sp.]
MIELTLDSQHVKIEKGELVSYQVDTYEIIHQKGNPGWRNSDTEMFPIIGPTDKANFRIQTLQGEAIQDQHGLLRELEYALVEKTETSVIFEKKYVKGTKVKNSKFPAKSTEELLSWPYDFTFKKHFILSENGLEVAFTIVGAENMPFMLGYHPAFKLRSAISKIKTDTKEISLKEIKEAGSKALPVLKCNSLTLIDEKKVQIKTEGFGNFMLWTEVDNMVCIEPITFYPYAVEQKKLNTGFAKLTSRPQIYKVNIAL